MLSMLCATTGNSMQHCFFVFSISPESHTLALFPCSLQLSDGVPQDLSSTGYIIHSTLSALHSLAQTTDSVKPLVSTKDSPSTMFTSNTADTRGSSLQQKPSPVPKSVVSRPEKSEVKAARSEPIPTQKEENELQVAFSRLKQKTAAEEVQNALKLAEPEPVEKALPERTKGMLFIATTRMRAHTNTHKHMIF